MILVLAKYVEPHVYSDVKILNCCIKVPYYLSILIIKNSSEDKKKNYK